MPWSYFASRSELKRPASIHVVHLENSSFYAFWRLFDVSRGSLIRKQTEKFLAVTGNGWPAQAKKTHERHAEYARKTLYAYMPCAGLRGIEYIDDAVRKYFHGNYGRALEHFIMDTENLWCPRWIKRNYEIQNKPTRDITAPAFLLPEADSDLSSDSGLDNDACTSDAGEKPTRRRKQRDYPHADKYKVTYAFEPDGEPKNNGDSDEEDELRGGTVQLTHWDKKNRDPWQLAAAG